MRNKLALLSLATLGIAEPTIGNISQIQENTNQHMINVFQANPKDEKRSDTYYFQWKEKNQEKEKSHAEIIKMNVDQILSEYGTEKWLDTIRQHVLIEINKIRQDYGLQVCNQNKKLTKTAQDYSKYMSDNNRFNHEDKSWKSHRQRIKDIWYPFGNPGEVIAKWESTIEEFITMCLYSQGHLNQINWTYFFDAGVWYCNGYRVVDFWGNK